MSKVTDLIDAGDWGGVIGVALDARFAAEEGRYCNCETPDVAGYSLMCGNCLLENQGQIEKRLNRSRNSHPFQPMTKLPIMCEVCTGWEDDPRHKEAPHA